MAHLMRGSPPGCVETPARWLGRRHAPIGLRPAGSRPRSPQIRSDRFCVPPQQEPALDGSCERHSRERLPVRLHAGQSRQGAARPGPASVRYMPSSSVQPDRRDRRECVPRGTPATSAGCHSAAIVERALISTSIEQPAVAARDHRRYLEITIKPSHRRARYGDQCDDSAR